MKMNFENNRKLATAASWRARVYLIQNPYFSAEIELGYTVGIEVPMHKNVKFPLWIGCGKSKFKDLKLIGL